MLYYNVSEVLVGRDHSRPSARSGADHRAAAPTFSLLRLSASARVGGALLIVAALWGLVYWALR
jgi:hypothetical protein